MKKAHELAGGERDIAVYLIANENAIPFYKKLRKSPELFEQNVCQRF